MRRIREYGVRVATGLLGCGLPLAAVWPGVAGAARAQQAPVAVAGRGDAPQVCPRAIEPLGSFDPALWVANPQPRAGGPDATPVVEVRWIPLPDDPAASLGYVECAGTPWHSGFPAPTLRTRFAVHKPVTTGSDPGPWQAPSASWMLCSGATMQSFDVASCPFTPAR